MLAPAAARPCRPRARRTYLLRTAARHSTWSQMPASQLPFLPLAPPSNPICPLRSFHGEGAQHGSGPDPGAEVLEALAAHDPGGLGCHGLPEVASACPLLSWILHLAKLVGWAVLGSVHGPGCACACATWAPQAHLGSCTLMLASTLSPERRRASWTPHSSSPTTCRWSRRPRPTRCERRWPGWAVRSCISYAWRSGAQRSCFSSGSGPNQVRRGTTLLWYNTAGLMRRRRAA